MSRRSYQTSTGRDSTYRVPNITRLGTGRLLVARSSGEVLKKGPCLASFRKRVCVVNWVRELEERVSHEYSERDEHDSVV
jgi:hypothetical protein